MQKSKQIKFFILILYLDYTEILFNPLLNLYSAYLGRYINVKKF